MIKHEKNRLLLAKTAHEINSLAMSLSADIKMLGKILGPDPSGSLSELIDDMNGCVNRISCILKRVTEHSSMDCRTHLETKVHDVVCAALKIAMPGFCDVVTVNNFVDEKAPVIKCDETMLCQALVNLLKNAAHAACSHDSEKTVTVSYEINDSTLSLSVRDTGPGIDPELKKNLFKPFVSTKKGSGGMGLGLFIAREIAMNHKGDLHVESEPGHGARFIITLPL